MSDMKIVQSTALYIVLKVKIIEIIIMTMIQITLIITTNAEVKYSL